jgi:Phosphotransferase enzyme family
LAAGRTLSTVNETAEVSPTMQQGVERMREIERSLSLLSGRGDVAYRLLGRYEQGESGGVYRVADETGRRFAFKVAREDRVRRAAATTEVLRQLGYPAPAYRGLGRVSGDKWYAVIEEMPGQPLTGLTRQLVDQLLALVEKQAGRAYLPIEEPRVVDTLLTGADGYALHETMRAYSSATSGLLDEVIAIGRRYFDLDYPNRDIVHHDFHAGNMLSLDGRVSGIVDWESTGSGDRAFDISTLLFYEQDETNQAKLWQALLELAGRQRATVYLAHMMLRQVEWSARHHDAATVQHYLKRSEMFLTKLKELRQP